MHRKLLKSTMTKIRNIFDLIVYFSSPSGATPNKPCIFPFKFNGVIYNECTWTSAHLTEHKPWCSTFVDESGEN